MMSVGIKIGATYQHYKGNHYKVLDIVHHHETGEEWVVYEGLYDGHLRFIRPLDMFMENVEWNGKKVPRFRCVEEELESIPNSSNYSNF